MVLRGKTRFNHSTVWFDSNFEPHIITKMSTDYLMNLAVMIATKPIMSIRIAIIDLQQYYKDNPSYSLGALHADFHDLSSMSSANVIMYFMESALYVAIVQELHNRNFNIENIIAMEKGRSRG